MKHSCQKVLNENIPQQFYYHISFSNLSSFYFSTSSLTFKIPFFLLMNIQIWNNFYQWFNFHFFYYQLTGYIFTRFNFMTMHISHSLNLEHRIHFFFFYLQQVFTEIAYNLLSTGKPQRTNLKDIAGSVSNHCNKASYTVFLVFQKELPKIMFRSSCDAVG